MKAKVAAKKKTEKRPKFVTSKMLMRLHACPEQITLFEAVFPPPQFKRGVPLTRWNVALAIRRGLSVPWLLLMLEDERYRRLWDRFRKSTGHSHACLRPFCVTCDPKIQRDFFQKVLALFGRER